MKYSGNIYADLLYEEAMKEHPKLPTAYQCQHCGIYYDKDNNEIDSFDINWYDVEKIENCCTNNI